MDTLPVRERVWLEAWKAAVTARVCNTPEGATIWADKCLKEFDIVFPEHKRKNNEQNPY